MKGASNRENCASLLNVSRETMFCFDKYLDLLSEWQEKLNLVGSSTLRDPWTRHILDCGQLASFIKEKDEKIKLVGEEGTQNILDSNESVNFEMGNTIFCMPSPIQLVLVGIYHFTCQVHW